MKIRFPIRNDACRAQCVWASITLLELGAERIVSETFADKIRQKNPKCSSKSTCAFHDFQSELPFCSSP